MIGFVAQQMLSQTVPMFVWLLLLCRLCYVNLTVCAGKKKKKERKKESVNVFLIILLLFIYFFSICQNEGGRKR